MNKLNTDNLKKLMDHRDGPCVTITMPVRKGAEAPKNEIRLKDQLKAVERQLVQKHGMADGKAEAMLAPIYALASDLSFWSDPGEGLALYFTPGEDVQAYMLPASVRESASVGKRFSLRSVLPTMIGDGKFYILAVSQNAVRLLAASRYTVNQIPLNNIPTSVREMLRIEGTEEQEALQFRSGTSTPGRSRQGLESGGVMFSGQGAPEDDDKIRIAEFFNIVDKEVRRWIDDGTRAPLVLAGVEYLHAIYREQSEYPNLITGEIHGNHDETSDADLHARAWGIVEPMFRQEYDQATEAYMMHTGRADGLATDKLEDIVPAAVYQRIATLFYNPNVDRWGAFNEETGEITLHDDPTSDSDDLVDLAVHHALMNGGAVYAVDQVPGQEQGGGLMAAQLRF